MAEVGDRIRYMYVHPPFADLFMAKMFVIRKEEFTFHMMEPLTRPKCTIKTQAISFNSEVVLTGSFLAIDTCT